MIRARLHERCKVAIGLWKIDKIVEHHLSDAGKRCFERTVFMQMVFNKAYSADALISLVGARQEERSRRGPDVERLLNIVLPVLMNMTAGYDRRLDVAQRLEQQGSWSRVHVVTRDRFLAEMVDANWLVNEKQKRPITDRSNGLTNETELLLVRLNAAAQKLTIDAQKTPTWRVLNPPVSSEHGSPARATFHVEGLFF